jgi:NADH-quinone oxidoreductase subunit N
LFSLAGIPPTAGFFGKIFLLKAGAAKGDLFLITFAALNMIIALSYYLRVIKAMFMEESEQPIPTINSGVAFKVATVICLLGIVLTGFVGQIYGFISELSKGL